MDIKYFIEKKNFISNLFLYEEINKKQKSVGSEIRTLVTTATTLDPDH